MQLAMIKKNNDTFQLLYNSDIVEATKLKTGQLYHVTVKRKRNLKHHKKFWAILRLVANNTDYSNEQELLYATKIVLGYVKKIKLFKEKKAVAVPDSISFERMNQSMFEKFYDSALNLFAKYLHCSIQDIEDNSIDYM